MATNTVKANVTGGSAIPTDVALVSANTASAVVIRDANKNFQTNMVEFGITTTATAAGTTTLTVSSTPYQVFTGSTTQIVQLPNATTLNNGHWFDICNQSTGTVTIKDAGSNTLTTLANNCTQRIPLISNGSSNGTWDTCGVYGTGLLGVVNGGTGLATLTANNVILGNGTSTPSFVAPGTSGNVLTSNGTTWTSATPASGSGVTFVNVTGTTQTTAANSRYLANNASLVTFTLPSSPTVGDWTQICGGAAGGWKLAQLASQQIFWNAGGTVAVNNTTSGTGGYLASTDRYDSIEFICIAANTYAVISAKGSITLV
jgi:hypothetical protein